MITSGARTTLQDEVVMRVVVQLLTGLALLAVAAAAPPSHLSPVDLRVLELIRSGRDDDLRWPDLADVRADLEAYYAGPGGGPIWTAGGRPTPAARNSSVRSQGPPIEASTPPTTMPAGWRRPPPP